MRHLCLTVSEDADAARGHLAALLLSLRRQNVPVDLVLVLRGGAAAAPRAHGRVVVHQLAAPLRISLSAARNLALRHAREHGLLAGAGAVAFPDDDCTYPDGLLARVERHLADGLEVVTGCYGPSPEAIDLRRFPAQEAPLTPGLVMRATSSCTMFLRSDAVRRIGDFDERLGLGARYGASEDSDYLLRALSIGLSGAYRPSELVVLHPYKARRATEYYLGNVAVLAKHAHSGGTRALLARRLLGGALLAARAQLAPAELRRALAVALKEAGHAR